MRARPVEFQPPVLEMRVKVTSAVFLGFSVQNTMIMARNPKTWTINMTFWKRGIALAPYTFKAHTKKVTAMTMRVHCHLVAAYSGYMTVAEDWIRVPTKKGPEAVPACHDTVDIHPVK